MEGNEQISVPKLKVVACKHPEASDTKGPKPSSTPAKDKEKKEEA